MSTFYLINTTKIGTRVLWPGSLIDDAQESTSDITAAGGRLITSGNATVTTAALRAQEIRNNGGSIEEASAVMLTAMSKSDAEGTDAATIASTTATMVAEARSGHVRYTDVPAAALTGLVNTVDIADGTLTIAAQPVVPCKLQVRIVDADSSISAGTCTIPASVGPSGEVIPEQVINLAGGTRTVTTTYAYASFVAPVIAGVVGAVTGDTIGIGPSGALGLPGQKTPASSGFAVHKANVDGAAEAVGTVDAAAGTIAPTTAPNGSRDYDFWYTFAVTSVQNAHTHTATLS